MRFTVPLLVLSALLAAIPARATPTSTALATTPRTWRTRIASDAIATRIVVSTTRSTTTVPRVVVRLTPSRSPR